jgi:hypothetical protein
VNVGRPVRDLLNLVAPEQQRLHRPTLGEPDHEEEECGYNRGRAPDDDRDDAGERKRRRGRPPTRELLTDVAGLVRRRALALLRTRKSVLPLVKFRHEKEIPAAAARKLDAPAFSVWKAGNP